MYVFMYSQLKNFTRLIGPQNYMVLSRGTKIGPRGRRSPQTSSSILLHIDE